ncbi:cystine ABC transporter permease [Telmatospirillum siberiense]|uniref:Amino acid ABC transporter permease n=1 Tax=Telmatospirillum siberiense TaxID=382514 RepID=A0A2N3PX16_9PROT|nr:cystine ABC transporter permease [Telmatospirillum siberiense]PKU24950.1 amino acid ABC transporter permease [Telmatospirillum siberiense]
MNNSIDLLIQSLPFLLKGAAYTVELAVGGMLFGLILGFILALMRRSSVSLLKGGARFYVSFIRGTPLLVQLFVIYYGFPQFGLRLDPIPSALIGLSLNVGGYTAEIWRAAIASVDRGQIEAAESLGMTPFQTMMRTVLPQATRLALPPLGNTFISLVKDTALAATIQVPELFRQAQLITARTYQVFTMYLAAAALYWVLSGVLGWLQLRLEARVSLHVQET